MKTILADDLNLESAESLAGRIRERAGRNLRKIRISFSNEYENTDLDGFLQVMDIGM